LNKKLLEKVSSKSLFSFWKKALGNGFAKVAIHKVYMPQNIVFLAKQSFARPRKSCAFTRLHIANGNKLFKN